MKAMSSDTAVLDDLWHYADDARQTRGPISLAHLTALWNEAKIDGETLVCRVCFLRGRVAGTCCCGCRWVLTCRFMRAGQLLMALSFLFFKFSNNSMLGTFGADCARVVYLFVRAHSQVYSAAYGPEWRALREIPALRVALTRAAEDDGACAHRDQEWQQSFDVLHQRFHAMPGVFQSIFFVVSHAYCCVVFVLFWEICARCVERREHQRSANICLDHRCRCRCH